MADSADVRRLADHQAAMVDARLHAAVANHKEDIGLIRLREREITAIGSSVAAAASRITHFTETNMPTLLLLAYSPTANNCQDWSLSANGQDEALLLPRSSYIDQPTDYYYLVFVVISSLPLSGSDAEEA